MDAHEALNGREGEEEEEDKGSKEAPSTEADVEEERGKKEEEEEDEGGVGATFRAMLPHGHEDSVHGYCPCCWHTNALERRPVKELCDDDGNNEDENDAGEV